MSAQSVINDFFEALQSISSPAVEYLQRPLSPEEITAQLTTSNWIQAEWVDSWVLEWWSHHNGLIPMYERPTSHEWAHEVCFGMFALFSVPDAVDDLKFKRRLILEQAPRDLITREMARITEHPFVPLSVSLGGHTQCLRKTGESDGRWQLWDLMTSLDWVALIQKDGSPLYFEDVLTRFVEAAADDKFAIGESGRVITGNPAESRNDAWM